MTTSDLPTLADLRPGDLALCPIGGFIPGALPVGAGQLLFAGWKSRMTWRRWRMVRHAATVTEAAHSFDVGPLYDGERMGHGPKIAQAMPSGFEEIAIGLNHWTDDYVYIRPRYKDGQAEDVAFHAREMVRRKIPYGFVNYAAITANRINFPAPHLDEFVSRKDADGYPRQAICSQAVDAQLTLSGFQVFNDGRLSQDVMPAELYLRLLDLGPAAVFVPGLPAETPRTPLTRAVLTGRPAPIPTYLLT